MNPWRGLSGLPRSIWVLSLSTLINRLGTLAVFFLTLFLVQGRGWREGDAALAMALYGLGALLASPFSGRLADRIGHRKLLAWSLLLSAVSCAALPLAHQRPVLLGLVFLWSALTQAFWPASMALITDLAPPDRRKQAFVLHRLASNLGLAIGPAAGGFIAHWSFDWLFWIDGATTLVGLAVLLAWVPGSAPHPESPHRAGSAWPDVRLRWVLLALLPALLVFTQIHGALPLWISRDLGFGTRTFGLVFTFNTLLILLFEVALNLRVAAWSHGHQLAAGVLLFALGFGLTGWAGSLPLLALSVALWTFGEMIVLPASSDAVAALAPPERRGEYMGLYSLTWTVALSLGPWLGLRVYAGPGPLWVWGGCAAVALISALALWRFRTSPIPVE